MVSEMVNGVEIARAYPFEVTVNNPEAVKVAHAGSDPGQLWTIKNGKCGIRKTASGLTSCRRFAPGLDLVYSITFPCFIQGETMRKE